MNSAKAVVTILAAFLWVGWIVPARADLRIPAPQVDLGEVKSGARLSQSFELVNNGPEALEFLEARPSCGCLKPRLEPQVLEANARGKLILQVNTLGQSAGPHTWSASLRYCIGSREGEMAVQVSARLITEVTVQPASLTLITGKAMTQQVTLTDLRQTALTITGVQTSSPVMKARLLQQYRDRDDRWVGRIQIDAVADSPGRHDETLSIYTSDPVYGHLQVPVTIIQQAACVVSATPARVLLQLGPQQPAPAMLVRIRSATDQPVRIDKIEADNPALLCRWASGPQNQATVKIQVDPDQPISQCLDGTVHIHVTSPVREILSVPVKVDVP